MEVVGLIAAVPGLIDLVTKTIDIVQAFANHGVYVRQLTELADELDVIEKILVDILKRLRSSAVHRSHLGRLEATVKELKLELTSLNILFSAQSSSHGRKTQLLKKARFFVSGLESKIKSHHAQLEKAKSLLTLVIVSQNEEIAEEILVVSRSQLRLKLQDILRPCGYDFIPRNLPGTCEWIWSHPSFCEWMKPRVSGKGTSQLMCIYGSKGCGKSVLATAIVAELKSQGKVALGFSFWAGSEDQRRLLALLRTMLWNLIQRIPDDELHLISAPLMDSLPLSTASLEGLVSKALVSAKGDVYCVIDGIDEATDDWTQPDSESLKLIMRLARDCPSVGFLLVGREVSIRAAAAFSTLQIRMTEELVRSDIDRLIRHHMEHSLRVQSDSARELIHQSLQGGSRDMFLWVTLIFRELSRCRLPNEISRTLEQIPHDLDREYSRLFLQLQNHHGGTRIAPSITMQRTRCLLSLIIAAPEPLTLDELSHAFAISQCPRRGYEQYIINHDGILDTCGDFVEVTDGRYHLIHKSMIDFLTRPSDVWHQQDEAIEYFHIDIPEAENNMSVNCFNYFRFSNLGYPLADESLATLHKQLPFLSRALRFTFVYLMKHYNELADTDTWLTFKLFLRSSEFWASVEYAVLLFRDDSDPSSTSMEFMEFICWIGAADTTHYQPIKILDVTESLEEELTRRISLFGPDDDRCRVLEGLGGTVHLLFAHHITTGSTVSDQASTSISVEEINGSSSGVSASSQTMQSAKQAKQGSAQRAALSRMSQAVFAGNASTIMNVFASHLMEKPLALLPIPVLILMALTAPRNSPKQVEYWSIAAKRLSRTNTFLEAFCKMELGAKYSISRDSRAEECLRRSLEVTKALRPSVPVHIVTNAALKWLSRDLLMHDRADDARIISLQLRDHFSQMQGSGYTYIRLDDKSLIGLFWKQWKADTLLEDAKDYLDYGDASDALPMLELLMEWYESPSRQRSAESIEAHYARMRALWYTGNDEGCEASCRRLLELTAYPNFKKDTWEQWSALSKLLQLLYKQKRIAEAEWLIAKAPVAMPIDDAGFLLTEIASISGAIGSIERARKFFDLAKAAFGIEQKRTNTPLLPETEFITGLVGVLSYSRPILAIRRHIYPCVQEYIIWKAEDWQSQPEVLWGDLADFDQLEFHYRDGLCLRHMWDVFHIRHLELRLRSETYSIESIRHGLIDLAFEYLWEDEFSAGAAVWKYLGRYLSKQTTHCYALQWGLAYTAHGLLWEGRQRAGLVLCMSMIFRASLNEFEGHERYAIAGSTCLCIGKDLHSGGNSNDREWAKAFLAHAAVSYWRAEGIATRRGERKKMRRKLNKALVILEELGVETTLYRDSIYMSEHRHRKTCRRLIRHKSTPDLVLLYDEQAPRPRRNSIR